jgi:hypothetical protein
LRGIDVASPDLGDVAQTDQAAVRGDIDGHDVLLGAEGAGDPQRQLLVAGLQRAGRSDRVLGAQRRDDVAAIDAQSGHLLRGELDDNGLVLGAQDLDLGYIRHAQQSRTDGLDMVAQLTVRKTIGGEAVDDAKGVAELVVEARPDDAGRQGVADITDALADVIPDVGDLARRRASFQRHEDGGETGAGVAAQKVQARRFLERALDPLRHLVDCLLQGRARPRRLHDHRPEGECRILVAAEAIVGDRAHDGQREHAIHDEGTMTERPP